MNERLKELRVKAINYCMDKGSQGNLSEEVSQKFAELIVRECADFIDSKLEMTKYSGEVLSWVDGDDLKKHFGVE